MEYMCRVLQVLQILTLKNDLTIKQDALKVDIKNKQYKHLFNSNSIRN